MSLFEYGHLPEGGPRQVASHMADVAVFTLMYLDDGPELFAGLRKLIEGKDCFVRQSIVDRRVSEQPT